MPTLRLHTSSDAHYADHYRCPRCHGEVRCRPLHAGSHATLCLFVAALAHPHSLGGDLHWPPGSLPAFAALHGGGCRWLPGSPLTAAFPCTSAVLQEELQEREALWLAKQQADKRCGVGRCSPCNKPRLVAATSHHLMRLLMCAATAQHTPGWLAMARHATRTRHADDMLVYSLAVPTHAVQAEAAGGAAAV